MVYAKDVFTKFLKGFKRTAVFAITTRCNCKCLMCDMYRQPPKTVSIEGAKEILDFLSKNKFLIVYFTGGEPTLHPNVVEIVEYANKLGLVTAMTTNGTASKETVTKLKDAGLYLLTVSFDHWDPSVCEKIRRHTGIKAKQESVIKHCREVGLRTHTLTFLNSNEWG
ncbi:MAG: radical SAM protein [Candidatus Bathyarchaeia archaeon]